MAQRIKRDLWTDEIIVEEFDPSPTGRTIIFRGSLPYGDQTVLGRAGDTRAVSDLKPHESRSLGVPVAQVDRFNAELEKFGVTEARYSKKTGFIESTNDEHRHAAWAIRGHFNPDGGNCADKWGNAIGF